MTSNKQWLVLNPHYSTGYFLGTTTAIYSSTLFTIAGVFWFNQADAWYRIALFLVSMLVIFLLSRALARHSLKVLSYAFSVATALYLSLATYLFGYVIAEQSLMFVPKEHMDVLAWVQGLLTFLALWSLSFSILSFYAWSRIQHPLREHNE